MKQLTILAALFASTAFANNLPDPVPGSSSTAISGSNSSANSSGTVTSNVNASNSIGNVSGGSVGNTSATGGTSSSNSVASGGAGGSSSASAESGDSYSASRAGDVTSNNSSKFLTFPQPVWTSVPTPYGCLVTEAKAGALGWNFVSGSSSKQYSDSVCTTIRMAEAAMLHCQYATAAMLNQSAFESMYPGKDGKFFMLGNPENLGPVACDDLKRPKLRMETTINMMPQASPVAKPVEPVLVEKKLVDIPKSCVAAPKKSKPKKKICS